MPTDKLAIEQGCYLDFTLADKIIKFAESVCTIWTDDYSGRAGRKLKLLPWQKTFIRTAYGWRNSRHDLRYKYCSVWLGRRQGKSMLMAVLALYTMLTSPRTKIPIVASDIEEARGIYDRIHDMVVNNSLLFNQVKKKSRINVVDSHKTIIDQKHLGEIKILSSEKGGKLGKGCSLILLDEIAAWSAHSARHIFNSLYDSTKDKNDALMISISTPQHDLSSLGYEKYLLAEKVSKCESQDTTLLPVIYSAPDNWREDIPAALAQALPSLNITTPIDTYLDEWRAVEGTVDESRFIIMNLGLWVSSPTVWIPNSFWTSCQSRFNESQFHHGQYDNICVGADWASSHDLNSYCIVIEKQNKFYILPRGFMPRDRAQDRENKTKVPLLSWSLNPQNNFYLTEGNIVDPDFVLSRLKNDRQMFGNFDIRFDPTKMALVQQLYKQNGFNCIEVGTSPRYMSPAFEKLEGLIRGGLIQHNNNPVLNWCLGNCKPKKNESGQLMVTKSSSDNLIDHIDAASIALTHWIEERKADPTVLPQGQSWLNIW